MEQRSSLYVTGVQLMNYRMNIQW